MAALDLSCGILDLHYSVQIFSCSMQTLSCSKQDIFSWRGSETSLPHWDHEIVATEPPEKSPKGPCK